MKRFSFFIMFVKSAHLYNIIRTHQSLIQLLDSFLYTITTFQSSLLCKWSLHNIKLTRLHWSNINIEYWKSHYVGKIKYNSTEHLLNTLSQFRTLSNTLNIYKVFIFILYLVLYTLQVFHYITFHIMETRCIKQQCKAILLTQTKLKETYFLISFLQFMLVVRGKDNADIFLFSLIL